MNPRQTLFCEEYIRTLSASEAARRAGYSERTAGQIGFENLKKPDIRKAIRARRKEIADLLKIRREEWIGRLWKIALEAPKAADRIRALRQVGLAMGWYAPEKHEVSVAGGITFVAPDENEELEALRAENNALVGEVDQLRAAAGEGMPI